MALLLVGFGLRDSIMEIVNNQYKNIWTYDVEIAINDTDIPVEETGFAGKQNRSRRSYRKSLLHDAAQKTKEEVMI